MKKPKAVTVERKGDQIIIPAGMSYPDARDWITKQEQAEEKLCTVADVINCFPLDGMVALARAMEEKFGFTQLADRDGMWGPEPPVLIQVPTPDGFVTAPFGKMKPPKWEGGFLTAAMRGSDISIGGTIKRKFEDEVKEMIALTREMVKTRSIYRGQAIHMDLTWQCEEQGSRGFDIFKDAPQFMNLDGDANLILKEEIDFALKTNILSLIERGQFCDEHRISKKHGALFKGPYGTGKTLTSKLIAQKAVANGWTFIYLRYAHHLAEALRIAKLYAPAVLFVEDIDTVVSNRDVDMNDLLNTLDGVDTKTAPIITILTTNHAEVIHPSFLRAGRIDTVIHFSAPDGPTAAKFVKQFAGAVLADDVDLGQVGEALKDIVPAFICEAVSKAKRYANYRTGKNDITGMVTTDDLLKAARAAREQVEMMAPKKVSMEQHVATMVRDLNTFGRGQAITVPSSNGH